MVEGPAPDRFKHDPLPDPGTYIRLLEIFEGPLNQHVICEVSTWPVDDVPPYYAISYTWGDPTSTTNITLNGKPMTVRRNCEYVLQQAFALKASKYFWVDAICIDQESIHEKNHQVAMMGQIYKRATHVFACVGPHENDSEFLYEFVAKRTSLMEDISSLIDTRRFRDSVLISHHFHAGIYARRLLVFRLLFKLKSAVRSRLYIALMSFLKRPYFSRLWVLQELFHAQSLSCCCGLNVHPFSRLFSLSMLASFWGRDRWHWPQQILPFLRSLHPEGNGAIWSREPFDAIESALHCLVMAMESKPREASYYFDGASLLKNLGCADARDRLFGVIGLIDWKGCGVSAPVPDYGKNGFQLAMETFRLYEQEFSKRRNTSYLSEATRMLALFEVHLATEGLRKAIESRREPQNTPEEPIASADDSFSLESERWVGARIHSDLEGNRSGLALARITSDKSQATSSYISRQQRDPALSMLIDSRGRAIAYVSKRTKPGDWYLKTRTAHRDDEWGHRYDRVVVSRTTESGVYSMVGPTLEIAAANDDVYPLKKWKGQYPRSDAKSWFSIHWHMEDLFVLAWRLMRGPSINAPESEMVEFLESGICCYLNSSYAMVSDGPSYLSGP